MTVSNLVWEGQEELELFSVKKEKLFGEPDDLLLIFEKLLFGGFFFLVSKGYELKRGRLGAFS